MQKFLKQQLWTIRTASKPLAVRKGLQLLRVIILTGLMYLKNFCALRASALTFFTLLSIIPVLALGFAIAKGFGLEEKLEQWLYSVFAEYPMIAEKMVEFASNTLNGAKGGVIAGVGAAVLFYTTIKLLMQIEEAFNGIWGVQAPRTWLRMISDYLSLVLLCPILIAINGSMNAFAAAQIAGAQQVLPFLEGGLSVFLTKLISFSATWILFVFIYIFIPNTRVRFVPALCGGLIAAFLYYLVQSVYIAAQFLAAKYNAIYGGFAAFPLFLLWLQVSWTIVLFGSEVVFSIQNVNIYEGMPLDCTGLGTQRKMLYALRIMRYCSLHFDYGKKAPTEEEIAADLEIPLLGVRAILPELVKAKLLSCIHGSDRSSAYQIALPPEKITAIFVLEKMMKRHEEHISEEDQKASEILDTLWKDGDRYSLKRPVSELEI